MGGASRFRQADGYEHTWTFFRFPQSLTIVLLMVLFFPTICNLWLEEWSLILRNPLFWSIHLLGALHDSAYLENPNVDAKVKPDIFHHTRILYQWTFVLDLITTILQAGTMYKRRNSDIVFQFCVLSVITFLSFVRFVRLSATATAENAGRTP